MKKLFSTMLLMIAATMTMLGTEPPEGTFTWGVQVPLTIDYQASDTLSVTSATITQYTVTYELVDPSMAQYIAINGNVVTVLKHYAGSSEVTQNKIYIKAVISGMSEYDDTELMTYIKTRKIYPAIQWNCTLGDMVYGSMVKLAASHSNTDRPDMEIIYTAVDNVTTPSMYVSIDQTTDTMTAVKAGKGVYIIAKIDSTDNFKATSMAYLSDDNIIRFDVLKADRTISWDSTDLSGLNNMSGDIQLRVISNVGEDSITIVSDNPQVADVLPGKILRIYQPGRVRLTATIEGTENYNKGVSDTTINIAAITPVVTWDEDIINYMDQYKTITSTTCGESMKKWVNSNYGEDAEYVFSIPQSEQDIAKVENDTALCCYGEGVIHLAVVAKAAGCVSQSITHDINIHRGYLEFKADGDWDEATCWSRSDLLQQTENHYINIVAKCTLRNGYQAKCKGLNIYANGSLTIEPEGVLSVSDTLNNFGSENSLILKADKARRAEVKMGNGNPLATVEMYLDHTINGRDTVWSSHGVSLDKGTISSSTGKLRIKQWNDGWEKKARQTVQLEAFEGYLITDTVPNKYSVVGRLVSGDKRYTLRRSQGGSETYVGRNFITNSYSSHINMSAVEFEDMQSELFEPVNGQYRTLPKYSSYSMGYGEWKSGRSVFAKANSNESKVKVDYGKAVMQEEENQLLNTLKISVTGQTGYTDTLVLMDASFGTEQYDDGWDGTKWEGDTCMPQLYATTKWGKAYVNVEPSIVAQRIGFKAARNGETYTIRFHTEGLDGSYGQLYLFDAKNQTFADIIGGEEYKFTGSTLGENDRFTIMRDKVVPEKDKYGRSIMVLGNKVLLVGFENSDMPVRVVNFEGKVVCEYNTKDGPWLKLPHLVPGFYFINVERCTTKFFR